MTSKKSQRLKIQPFMQLHNLVLLMHCGYGVETVRIGKYAAPGGQNHHLPRVSSYRI